MAASTNKKSIRIETRSFQNRKRCLVNNENAKSVKLFPQLNYLLLFFTSSECCVINPLSANPTKWSNTLKQFTDELFECVWPLCEIGA